MGDVRYLGYVECDHCDKYAYIDSPAQINIWYHPDDDRSALAETVCSECGELIVGRIDFNEMMNFRKRGCVVRDYNDKFPPLTKEMVDQWDDSAIEEELKSIR